jgi:hypothetical protein
MSDTWYREPFDPPPFEDGLGQLWTWDGTCLNPRPVEPSFLDGWPEDLRPTAFKAAVNMELLDSYRRILDAEADRMFVNPRGNPPRGILAALDPEDTEEGA